MVYIKVILAFILMSIATVQSATLGGNREDGLLAEATRSVMKGEEGNEKPSTGCRKNAEFCYDYRQCCSGRCEIAFAYFICF